MSRGAKAGRPPRQTPYKRSYPSGRTAWIARYYDLDGKTRYAKPRWNAGKSAFARKGDAQRAIDEALERLYGIGAELAPERIGDYYEGWLRRHPRSARTDKTNADRVSYVLDVEIEGRALGDWEFDELRRRQALALLDHMLRAEGRAAEGARGILRALSAMAEDAIGDDVATHNAFIGIRLRSNDPRIKKPPRGRLWRERNFYRDVWAPAQLATGMDPTPHEFRHSYVSHLRATGGDDADLARVAGHTVETMISVYTHPLDRSHEQIRGVIG